MLMFRCEMQRQGHMQARLIESVAFGYSGVRSEKGPSVMRKMLNLLRG